jgi:hypothetical protein
MCTSASKAEYTYPYPYIQVCLQKHMACDRDVVDLVGNVLEDGVAIGEAAYGAEVDLGNAAQYGRGTGEVQGAHVHG